jgi:2-methylfumaryl-CoA hydratase
MNQSKARAGNFFEDFAVGQILTHATPRTLTTGDVALYTGLYGPRFAVQSSDAFAQAIGYRQAPVDDLLVFHTVFGKTVPDISLNAVANLGYADGRFLAAVYPGDTLTATSEVIGLRETSNRASGVVYVRTTGRNQQGEPVLEYARWVMVRRRDAASPAPAPVVPELAERVDPALLGAAVPAIDVGRYDFALAGSPHRWGDYAVGEKIDHIDGMTLEEAEHQIAARLYQNTAKVHFNLHARGQTPRANAGAAAGARGEGSDPVMQRRLVYGGVVISLARALSFNGLANAFHVAAINAGRHVAPCFAGDTVYAWSEVLEKAELPGRGDVGALRVRLVAAKNRACADFPLHGAEGHYADGIILDLDLWLLLPR